MFYLETDSHDPAYNLAFEQYILENCPEGEFLMLWQNDNTIVLGRNQNAGSELNQNYVNRNGIHVVRRMTGGGAVYHDLGNLNYSFIANNDELASIEKFTGPVCAVLNKMGIEARTTGRNDITVNGKKISGIAQRIYKERILHHGCILFDTDLSVLAKALKADRAKFESKGIKSVEARVANINNLLDKKLTIGEFWNMLKEELSGYNPEEFVLSENQLREIEDIAETRYRSWNWTYGKSPSFTYTNKKRFEGGTVEVFLTAKKGDVIESVRFFGDFMATEDIKVIEDALAGIPFEKNAVIKVLDIPEMKSAFGGITAENILELLGL